MKHIRRIYLALIMIFLYAPIAIMMLFSFNEDRNRAKFTGFSLQWYQSLIKDDDLIASLKNTLILALCAAVIATIIGTYAALLLNQMMPLGKKVTANILNIPILNAEIVTGLSLMMLFTFLSVPLGFFTILMAHAAFNVPYVVLSVLPKIRQLNKSTYEAALDLGATPTTAFRKVVFPEILPGIISGWIMAFTLSLDDFIISYFTSGGEFKTLSVIIYTKARGKTDLTINALSTVMFLAIFVLLLLFNLRKPKKEVNK